MTHDRREIERQGHRLWWGVNAGPVNQAVYVVPDRVDERDLRWYFGTVFDAVRAIVNGWDPYGLIRMGAPSDEYDGEISRVLLRLQHARSTEDATEIVLDELSRSFGRPPFGEPTMHRQKCEDIWREWQKFCLAQ